MTHPFELNLRHLRAVATIRRLGSLSAAAGAAGLSQPALTQGLAVIERRLDVALFDRRADGARATAAGAALADRAEAGFARLAAATRRSGRTRGFAHPDRLMSASQLRGFLALADAGSFVGASATIGVSQPAIHRVVRDLEQVVGVALAERRGRGVVLTEAGRLLARGARLAAAEFAAGIVEARGDNDIGHSVTIGAMPLARATLLPAALAAFIAVRPQADVRVVEGSWRELAEPLRDGFLDLMIGALRDDPAPDLVQAPLFDDTAAIVARAGHPLAERRATLDDLARYDWIVAGPGTPIRERWEAIFANRPLPHVPITCGSPLVTRGVLARSDLLTLLSPDQVAMELRHGLLARVAAPMPDPTRMIGVVTRAGWRPTTVQNAFLAALTAASGTIASGKLMDDRAL